jgi:hypothetical protein
MGGSAATHNNFWELFSRAAGSAQWKLATPPGVASNGGLIVSGTGSGLTAGFGPSQDLTFSPLAAVASPSANWSQGSALVSPGLANVPDALATAPGGKMLALTHTGEVLLGSNGGASWARLATLRSVASTTAGRACGLTALTAVAFTPAGVPLLAGSCSKSAAVGIFAAENGAIAPAPGPARPAGDSSQQSTVLALTTQDGRTTAVVEVGSGRTASIFSSWQGSGSSDWADSAATSAGGGPPRSVAVWGDGGVAVITAGDKAQTIAAPGDRWQLRPALPARTATLALGPDGQLEALSADNNTLTVWQLNPSGTGWSQQQVVTVTIPYGTSG